MHKLSKMGRQSEVSEGMVLLGSVSRQIGGHPSVADWPCMASPATGTVNAESQQNARDRLCGSRIV